MILQKLKNFFTRLKQPVLGARTATLAYPVVLAHGSFGPADSTTYYFGGALAALPTSSTGGYYRYYIPKAGTIKEIHLTMSNAGAFATTEDSTISLRLNGTTDYTISSSVKYNANGGSYRVTGLQIKVTLGDYLQVKWVTPAWVTNPTNVFQTCTVWIEY